MQRMFINASQNLFPISQVISILIFNNNDFIIQSVLMRFDLPI